MGPQLPWGHHAARYLSPEWLPHYGGQLVDVAADRSINPEFNKAGPPPHALGAWTGCGA
jgi:hypothetical protein